jgi:disulfide oxidoreductase YuzD
MANKDNIKWFNKPEDHDYPAAQSYLSLIFDEETCNKYITALKKAEMAQFKSKDIFRASGLSLLGISNQHVKKDIKKIEDSITLSPLLLVRDSTNSKLIIADGYHRLCAVYSFDEDALIPCKIV